LAMPCAKRARGARSGISSMSSAERERLFPQALIGAIRDARPPDRNALLSMARHLRRDLSQPRHAPLPPRVAARLSYRTLMGDRS
jgi:hypothetical protein